MLDLARSSSAVSNCTAAVSFVTIKGGEFNSLPARVDQVTLDDLDVLLAGETLHLVGCEFA